MKNVVVLGSTGSIGTQTLSVIESKPDDFSVCALAVNTSVEQLLSQTEKFHPAAAVIYDEKAYMSVKDQWPYPNTRLLQGMDGLLEIVSMEEADIVVTAMVGMIGLRPTVRAIESGKAIALANKETLVCAGSLIMNLAAEKNVPILPVDSEHGAIFQCLQGTKKEDLSRILLTASGGPFRGYNAQQLQTVTKAQALKHPSWNMGAKITIDSASLVNKALEMIEARWLFDVTEEQIQVVVHPQSIIHSMIELVDGTVLAQLGVADMRLPIQVALEYPKRGKRVVDRLDFTKLSHLDFEVPDDHTFVSLRYAREVLRKGGLYPAAMNIANELAVRDFLAEKIQFVQIYERIGQALEYTEKMGLSRDQYTLEDIALLEQELTAIG